ncbi:MAG: putative lipid II flippase FtsW [Candidatus Nealsonbacteria bacterium]|nr:putative lipid II flippase FtsW [Candidatus Nealsonbacteria bacterium]
MKDSKTGHPDYILASVVGILILLGVVILTSVSTVISQEKFGSPNFYLMRHLLYGILPGLILGYAAYRIPLEFWKKRAPILLLASLFLMILVFFPKIGINSGGASRWINLGITSFQPSELLKISFILYLAAWLPSLREKTKKNLSRTLSAFLAIMGIIGLLLALQPNVSTLGIIITCGILMYFLTGMPAKHALGIITSIVAIFAVLVKIAPYRMERVLVFLNPNLDPMGKSYQLKQALIAIGSGGIFGKGLGMSIQKFGFLPEPMADSIFAVLSEETGLIGSLIIVSLFLIFAWRGLKIAKKSADSFQKLACAGIIFWITIQAFVNMGSTIGILPLTGIPLPFISYGGSAIAAELFGIGILLNISRHL